MKIILLLKYYLLTLKCANLDAFEWCSTEREKRTRYTHSNTRLIRDATHDRPAALFRFIPAAYNPSHVVPHQGN